METILQQIFYVAAAVVFAIACRSFDNRFIQKLGWLSLLAASYLSGYFLTGTHAVADIDAALDELPRQPERLVDLGARLHAAGQRDSVAADAVGDGDRAHRAHFGRDGLGFAPARGEQHQCR